ncbi:MAG TPA: sugar ABC transporter permease [Bacillota bacterium]|nr:sugar ABC transporter permease [Bacillota bacterium]
MKVADGAPQAQDKGFFGRLSFKFDVRAYTMIIALAAIWILFSFLTEGRYLIPRNISNLSRQMSITAVLAIGMVMVIVATHIDLSVGSVLGLSGGLAAVLQVWYHVPTVWAILAALTLGVIIGAWHGYWVAYQKVPAFIVTLAGLLAYRGIILGMIKGLTVAPMWPDFKIISSGYLDLIPGILLTAIAILFLIIGRIRSRRSKLKYGFEVRPILLEILTAVFYSGLILLAVFWLYQYEGIPYPILVVLALVIIFSFITKNTQFGRQVYAMGGNVEAARLSGINIRRRTMMVFILASLLASIAGVLATARLNAATTTAGQNMELDAIASCVIGGTSLMGGTGTIPGAIIGALVMASIDNGLSMMNTEAFWQSVIKGFVLLFAVALDIRTKTKNKV